MPLAVSESRVGLARTPTPSGRAGCQRAATLPGGELLDLFFGEEGVEELLDDGLVVVGEGLDLLKLP